MFDYLRHDTMAIVSCFFAAGDAAQVGRNRLLAVAAIGITASDIRGVGDSARCMSCPQVTRARLPATEGLAVLAVQEVATMDVGK